MPDGAFDIRCLCSADHLCGPSAAWRTPVFFLHHRALSTSQSAGAHESSHPSTPLVCQWKVKRVSHLETTRSVGCAEMAQLLSLRWSTLHAIALSDEISKSSKSFPNVISWKMTLTGDISDCMDGQPRFSLCQRLGPLSPFCHYQVRHQILEQY